MFEPVSTSPPDDESPTESEHSSLFESPPDCCPLCGHDPETPGYIGINAIICPSCSANIVHYTPTHHFVYGRDHRYHVWTYQPIADTWDRDCPPTFVESPSMDSISFDQLADSDAELIHAIATDTLPEEEYTAIELTDSLKSDKAAILNKTSVTDPEEEPDSDYLSHLQSSVPKPTVFTPNRAYTTTPEELIELLKEETVEQQTLM